MHHAPKADSAPLIARKAHKAEQDFARTKSVRDLTDVVNYSAESKRVIRSLKTGPEKRKGLPIGQRWDK